MAYLDEAFSSATVTVATETALAINSANDLVNVPSNARLKVFGVVQCAAGTGGTAATVRVRQGSGVAGAVVGTPVVSPVAAAGIAQVVPFSVTDIAPLSGGQYTVTVAYAGNTSSVISSDMTVLVDAGILE